ncbi:ankyrin repeat and zinc finger domain-containing protein [Apiospora aurea]|uniref:Ankyrin repeat and zinc finger domain-containing protein n=1 Tax=Apiospora aurea TaxID=335848 RepID=A0ABR1QED3_9PEZI
MQKTDKKADDILRRPLYVYDLPHEVLSTLEFKESPAEVPEDLPLDPTPAPDTSTSSSNDNLPGSQSCSLCSLAFTSVEDQRGHQKSDLHHYNLKQKLRGNKPVTENEFESLIGDLDESLSGSDSDESDEDEDDKQESTLTTLLKKQATLASRNANNGGAEEDGEAGLGRKKKRGNGNAPMIWLSSPVLPPNNYFGIYRAILTPEQARNEDEVVEVIRKKQLDPIPAPKPITDGKAAPAAYKGPHVFMCMIGGGHFAAMVVSLAPRQTKHASSGPLNREATILAHKTFHRYTTRRKQGGSQSANDNAKGNAHSAGSSIRRYNEQALIDEVRQLLQEWKGLLDTSDLLFIRATGATNRRTLFGPYEGQVLRANDPRIRGFPFSTRRATQNELMRCFIELTRLKVREFDPNQAAKAQQEAQAKVAPSKPAKPVAPKLSEEEETALLHTNQLQAFVRRSKLPALLSYLKNNGLQADFIFQPADSQQNHHAPTSLHFSASQNSAPLVSGLLLKAGADPTLQNKEGKTAFELAGDRATRDAFRVARDELGEQKWDWEAAKVPPAMKRAEAGKREERERKESESKEAERKKAEEARLKLEGPKVTEKASKAKGILGGLAQKTAQEKREEEARGLTPEQKMRLDRERRARAAEERIKRMQGGS